jgi:quercetin dioxygenase-like cupin family protein
MPHRAAKYIVALPLLAVPAVLTVAGCDAPTKATRPLTQAPTTGPSLTVATGLTNAVLGRANLGVAHVHSNYDGFDVELKAQDNTDVSMSTAVIAPGGDTGWHGHPGLVVVLIKQGALTFYESDDPTCTPVVHPAGTVVLESSGHVHIARNEGTENVEFVATQFLPAGVPGRIDAPSPGNCPF